MTPNWEEIKATVPSGEQLVGEFERDRCDIKVRILEPFTGLSTGAHILYPAGPFLSYEGEEGEKRAAQLLRELYDSGCLLREKIHALRTAWQQIRHEVPNATDWNNRYWAERGKLRVAFRDGRLDQKAYQQALGEARSRRDQQWFERMGHVDRFFEAHFPEIVSHAFRQQIVAILEDEDHAFWQALAGARSRVSAR